MIKSKRTVLIIISLLIVFGVLGYFSAVRYYSHDVDGHTAVTRSIYLFFSGKDYVKVSEGKYVYKSGAFKTLISNECDGYYLQMGDERAEQGGLETESDILYCGVLIKDGKEYNPAGAAIFGQNFYSVNFRPYSKFMTEPKYFNWQGKDGYRLNPDSNEWEATTDGKTFKKVFTDSEILTLALEEAKKEKYRDEYHQNAVYSDVSSIELQIGNKEFGDGFGYIPQELSDEYPCIYTLRIMDKNDPLNSLILYYDAYTAKVIGFEELSD